MGSLSVGGEFSLWVWWTEHGEGFTVNFLVYNIHDLTMT